MGRVCQVVAILGTLALGVVANASPLSKLKKSKPDPVNSSLQDYLASVRVVAVPPPSTVGSLWVGTTPWAVLTADYKARNPGDLIVIHLNDAFNAATTGENKVSRAFSSNSAITGLVGSIGARNRLQNLFNANSGHSLDGKGASSLS